ncbi:hypothetical protein KM043_002115 [Ampulex compressa]|nr:hypothetical protein KM043_002115 [Ampulex compressa]
MLTCPLRGFPPAPTVHRIILPCSLDPSPTNRLLERRCDAKLQEATAGRTDASRYPKNKSAFRACVEVKHERSTRVLRQTHGWRERISSWVKNLGPEFDGFACGTTMSEL